MSTKRTPRKKRYDYQTTSESSRQRRKVARHLLATGTNGYLGRDGTAYIGIGEGNLRAEASRNLKDEIFLPRVDGSSDVALVRLC